MRVELKAGAVHLSPGQLLRLVDAQGSTVCALAGSVWITEENERRDVVLDPGDCHLVQHDGVTIVDALDSGAAVHLTQAVAATTKASRAPRA